VICVTAMVAEEDRLQGEFETCVDECKQDAGCDTVCFCVIERGFCNIPDVTFMITDETFVTRYSQCHPCSFRPVAYRGGV
jgi:hypothetical protein